MDLSVFLVSELDVGLDPHVDQTVGIIIDVNQNLVLVYEKLSASHKLRILVVSVVANYYASDGNCNVQVEVAVLVVRDLIGAITMLSVRSISGIKTDFTTTVQEKDLVNLGSARVVIVTLYKDYTV